MDATFDTIHIFLMYIRMYNGKSNPKRKDQYIMIMYDIHVLYEEKIRFVCGVHGINEYIQMDMITHHVL